MTTPTTTPTTALEAAQGELRDAMVPLPSDYLEDLSPQAATLLCWEAAKSLLTILTAAATSLGGDPSEPQPVVSEVLNGAAASLAGLTHVLVALGVLPQEAEDAMVVGTGAAD
jgi:hypothetical protein